GTEAAALAAKLGLSSRGELSSAKGWFIFETTKTGGALDAAVALRAEAGVEAAEPQLARLMQKRFTPNDPLFSTQWHLRDTNAGSGIFGLDVKSVWDTWKGTGIRIGIVDDGLQTTHPDLAPNVDLVNDHDWNDATPNDPSPDVTQDFHGTSCAGVAAARGNNALGVSGAAPEATLVGLRLIAVEETDQDDADAMNWRSDIIQVKSNSWGPADDGTTLEAPGTLMQTAFANAVQTGRGGRGTIFLWAAGNGGARGDDSNYDGYANSIYTIAVAAISNSGTQSPYSEPGANLLIAAPSDGGTLGIVTTDLTGAVGYNDGSLIPDPNYTNDFGGTSSACPLAAGCVALLLQSKPTLGWRDVQEILIRSAAKVAPTDSDWTNNGAGWHFNHKYGAGLLNAQAAVNLAATWPNLAPQQNAVSAQTGLSVSIPDNNATGITRTFNLAASSLRVERVTVRVNINHSSRGQLAVTLTSPGGTASRLAEVHSDTGDDYANWTFSTVRCWGENSAGNWMLKITDTGSGTIGTLTAATLTVCGTAVAANQPPSITAATISPASFSDETATVTSVTAADPEGDAITLSYQWQESADGVAFTPIGGGTASSLVLTNVQSGKKVRCEITATAIGGTSAPFRTSALTINRRPVELARHAQPYSYDSDLFLTVGGAAITRSVIINEFSQGPANTTKEWVELLVLQNSDLRGCTLGDLSATKITFASVALWSNVPAGTLIVIYKGTDRDIWLPADNLNLAGGAMVIPNNNVSVFVGTNWPSLGNINPDLIEFRGAGGAIIDALSFNGETTYTPALGIVGSAEAACFHGGTDAGAEILANWTVTESSTVTPAAGNGAANTAFVTALRNGTAGGAAPQFRFGAGSDLVPGLSIDATSGLVSGTPNVPGGGFFQIVIERFTGTTVVSQTYPLLVADAAGNYTLPAGKTWTLDQATSLTGNLLVSGTLDTNGRALSVAGKITLAPSASVTNASGSISYLQRSGAALAGTTYLLANAANDLSDIDGDGILALAEFALGLDPTAPSLAGLPSIANIASHLTLTFTAPIGASGVTDSVEVSGDLITWQSGPTFTETVSDTTAASIRTVVVRDLATTPPRYIRFRVSR
ncbi:MAG: S8 family serine peptidase, partial [Chthoniobacteraceae bacterium]